uniref:Uncharacterized protein n=1 Tax=Calidris pygmaea TaxID=425635 RepID=A0A8C3JBI4_9CHAR
MARSAAAVPVRGSGSTPPAPHSPPQNVETVAMELEDRCPICLDSWEDQACVCSELQGQYLLQNFERPLPWDSVLPLFTVGSLRCSSCGAPSA